MGRYELNLNKDNGDGDVLEIQANKHSTEFVGNGLEVETFYMIEACKKKLTWSQCVWLLLAMDN